MCKLLCLVLLIASVSACEESDFNRVDGLIVGVKHYCVEGVMYIRPSLATEAPFVLLVDEYGNPRTCDGKKRSEL